MEAIIADTDGKGTLRPGAKPSVQPHGTGGSGRGSRSGTSGFFIFLIVLIVTGGIFGVWYQFLASAVAKAQVEDLAVSARSFGASLVGLVWDKVLQWTGRGPGPGVSTTIPRYVPLDEELNYFQPIPAAGAAEELQPPPAVNGDGVYTIR